VRFPELAAKSKSVGGEVDMDPAVGSYLWNIGALLLTWCI
jgi:hypothetical protein